MRLSSVRNFCHRATACCSFQVACGTLFLHSRHPSFVCERCLCQQTHGHPIQLRHTRKFSWSMSLSSVLFCLISLLSNNSGTSLRFIPLIARSYLCDGSRASAWRLQDGYKKPHLHTTAGMRTCAYTGTRSHRHMYECKNDTFVEG